MGGYSNQFSVSNVSQEAAQPQVVVQLCPQSPAQAFVQPPQSHVQTPNGQPVPYGQRTTAPGYGHQPMHTQQNNAYQQQQWAQTQKDPQTNQQLLLRQQLAREELQRDKDQRNCLLATLCLACCFMQHRS